MANPGNSSEVSEMIITQKNKRVIVDWFRSPDYNGAHCV